MAARNHEDLLKHTFRLFSPSMGIDQGLTGLPADEFDEYDVWDRQDDESCRKQPTDQSSPKKADMTTTTTVDRPVAAASVPVNIPDWSKILLQEYKGSSRNNSCEGRRGLQEEEEEEEEEDGVEESLIPPHEVMWKRRPASLSVEEGIGRTLKGRDLRLLRNAIWAKTGFQV